ncbi:MAG: RdgB/HAM1 family non-canonical purine NTP pyrophosphatase [Epulopiscium sp.]|nr:RdgB/HAM1 family non-canonical purine NTP pyrophosphatase [Candidatus Epulonipiscium sp.]
MKTIIFATKNKDKVKEIREIMSNINVNIITMEEAGIDIDVIEDGQTFEENARKKAEEIMKESGHIVMADDSGLEIDCFDKAPGVYSARYLGENTPYEEKNAIILDKMKDIEDNKRSARFVCAIATAFPDGRATIITRDTMEGKIGRKAVGSGGFGYDPIFYPQGYQTSSADISAKEKNAISHRGKALRAMEKQIRKVLEK